MSVAVINPSAERIAFPDKEIELGRVEEDRHNLPGAVVIYELMIAFAAAGPYTFQIGLDGAVVKELRMVLRQGGVAPTMIAQAPAAQRVPQ